MESASDGCNCLAPARIVCNSRAAFYAGKPFTNDNDVFGQECRVFLFESTIQRGRKVNSRARHEHQRTEREVEAQPACDRPMLEVQRVEHAKAGLRERSPRLSRCG